MAACQFRVGLTWAVFGGSKKHFSFGGKGN